MNDEQRKARRQALNDDIDLRLIDLFGLTWADNSVLEPIMSDDTLRDCFASCLRTAYAFGYQDALREDREGRRGELAVRHGYQHN